jgi:hypothetical protein
MWESRDKQHYLEMRSNGAGQIDGDGFADAIQGYAADENYKTYLEIGTWNGLGSTKAFSEGFGKRAPGADYMFYSLECNRQKSADAAVRYQHNPRMHILNEVIWNTLPPDFYAIFPEARNDPTFRHWNEVDIANMRTCKLFLQRPNLPKTFDVVLLDGGEFTTYHEYLALKDRCRVLMLDDVNAHKCMKIMEELETDATWSIVRRDSVRSGYLVAERVAGTA